MGLELYFIANLELFE